MVTHDGKRIIVIIALIPEHIKGVRVGHQHPFIVEFEVAAEAGMPSLTEIDAVEGKSCFHLKHNGQGATRLQPDLCLGLRSLYLLLELIRFFCGLLIVELICTSIRPRV